MRLSFKDCTIRHDGKQYILSVERIAAEGKKAGERVEKVLGFYPKESQLLKGLIKHGLSSDAVTMAKHVYKIVEEAAEFIETKVIEGKNNG